MANDMPADTLIFNGIDGATGRYLTPPLTPQEVSRLARGAKIDPAHLAELRNRNWRDTEQSYATVADDPNDLASAGWGVVFAHDADPGLRVALQELLDHRRAQAAAKQAHFYKEYAGPDGYRGAGGDRPAESKGAFLARHGAAAGQPSDPNKVPYYLLLVGSPEAIPYRFQYQLDVEYAVGRIHFEKDDGKPDLEAYARYAASVVAAETGKVALPRRAAFFGVANEDDRSTNLSADNLVKPLPEKLAAGRADWTFSTQLRDQAHKADLAALLGGPKTPALLFTASHGMGFPKDHPRQLRHQGALLCQDWPGPVAWQGEIKPEHYFSADDVGDDARLLGLIAFHFACYGAGTPRLDEFTHLTGAGEREVIAPHALVARLPQRLLGHPKGGALAVVGHVERAWSCSFFGGARLGQQLQTFQATLNQLLRGFRVGYALEFFNQLYAALSTELSSELEEINFGRVPNDAALSQLWTSNNDARNYTLVGDPAVRLVVAAAGQAGGDRPTIGAVTVTSPPPAPGPAPATQSPVSRREEPPPALVPSPGAFSAPAPEAPQETPLAVEQLLRAAGEVAAEQRARVRITIEIDPPGT